MVQHLFVARSIPIKEDSPRGFRMCSSKPPRATQGCDHRGRERARRFFFAVAMCGDAVAVWLIYFGFARLLHAFTNPSVIIFKAQISQSVCQ